MADRPLVGGEIGCVRRAVHPRLGVRDAEVELRARSLFEVQGEIL
ncbi:MULTISPECIES: hypothetical protein [Streptomyces]|nr:MULTISPECIES: hypothetical protein [Streptomyces]